MGNEEDNQGICRCNCLDKEPDNQTDLSNINNNNYNNSYSNFVNL